MPELWLHVIMLLVSTPIIVPCPPRRIGSIGVWGGGPKVGAHHVSHSWQVGARGLPYVSEARSEHILPFLFP
jgi:hypothetical protein